MLLKLCEIFGESEQSLSVIKKCLDFKLSSNQRIESKVRNYL